MTTSSLCPTKTRPTTSVTSKSESNALIFTARFPFTVNEIFSCELNTLLEKFFEAPEPASADTSGKEADKEANFLTDKQNDDDKFEHQFFVTGKEEEVNIEDDIELDNVEKDAKEEKPDEEPMPTLEGNSESAEKTETEEKKESESTETAVQE